MIPLRSIIFLICLQVITSGLLIAQDPVSHNYTVDDGLPSNEIYDVFEDSLGYIWFASDHGISRFDGYDFKNYSTSDGLVHNTVFEFFEDHKHRVWMRTFNSSVCYMENGKIHSYIHNNSLRKFLGRNYIQTFAIDSLGNLWFMSIREPFGLYCQDKTTGKIKKIKLQTGYNAFIRELGGNKFIAGVDMNNGSDKKIKPDSALLYIDNTWLFRTKITYFPFGSSLARAACSGNGHYLFSYDCEITEIANNKIIRQLSMGQNKVVNINNSNNNFWITGKGLTTSISDTGNVFFREKLIFNVEKDRHGNYWLTTNNKGVLFIPNIRTKEFTSLKDQELKLLAQYEDRLYVINSKNNLIILQLTPAGPVFPMFTIKQEGENAGVIHDMFINRQKKEILFGAIAYNINYVLKNSKLSKREESGQYNKGLGFLRSSIVKGNRVYAAGNSGCGVFDEKGNNLYLSKKDGLSFFCTALCVDSSGIVWIGSADGLYRFYNEQTKAYQHSNSLFRQRVTDIECMPGGQVIVSTRGGGIIIMDKGRIYNLRAANGLTTDLCGKLAVEKNRFWVCTNNGLNKVSFKKGKKWLVFDIKRIQVNHGIPSNMVNDVLRYKDLVILATGKGLGWFNEKEFTSSNHTPPVYITEVTANQHIHNKNTSLKYNETNLSFKFIGLLYNNSGNVQYRYRLEGYEHDWHYTTERSVRYFNLPANTYRFVVAAMNENGVWNTQPATYEFSIPLHFSKTKWFLSLIILVIITIFWLIIYYYLRQRRIKERITSGMLLAELKTLRSQMKPHFIFNSLNSVQHFIIENDGESAHLYMSRFSNLMRKILENTQKNSIALASEVETLELYLSLEKLRFGKKFDYSILLPDTIPQTTEIPPMLIQPYIENAIWHGLLPKKENARLWLRFYLEENNTLVCEIEDNGIGRKSAGEMQQGRKHTSMGMKNIEERVGLLNRVSGTQITIEIIDLHDASGKAMGTKIVLKLPNACEQKL